MTVEAIPSDHPTRNERKSTRLENIKEHMQKIFSEATQYCANIEKSKEICDRENIKKHGKDWVNRCCG